MFRAININQRKDPTSTLTLRNAMVADVNRRYAKLAADIKRLLIDQDFLGVLNKYPFDVIPLSVQQADYVYERSAEKVQGFINWLYTDQVHGVLETTGLPAGGETPWSNMYVQSSYQKGMARARQELRKQGADIPSFEKVPGGIGAIMNQPFHAERLGLIYTRTWNEMKGVTDTMAGQLSTALARGMAEGKGPYQIAIDMVGTRKRNGIVQNIGRNRSRLIARTEIVQSHNEAALNEFERSEDEIGETVLVQWWSALDSRVRKHHDKHTGWHGTVMTKEEGRSRIGEPNCRCSLLPYIMSAQTKSPEKATRAARKEIAKFNRETGFKADIAKPAKTVEDRLKDAEKEAKRLGAPTVPKTSKEAISRFEKNMAKHYPNEYSPENLASWIKEFEDIDNISPSKLLKVQTAINENYANPAYKELMESIPRDDIIIVTNKKGMSMYGRVKNVTLVNDGAFDEVVSAFKPGEPIDGLARSLRKLKAEYLWENVPAGNKSYFGQAWDQLGGASFWGDNLSYRSRFGIAETYEDLIVLLTDPDFEKVAHLYDDAVKTIGELQLLEAKKVIKWPKPPKPRRKAKPLPPAEKFEPAKSKAAAKRYSQGLVDRGAIDDRYPKTGGIFDPNRPAMRYRHERYTWRTRHRAIGKVTHGQGATLDSMNDVNEKFLELQERCEQLGLPPMRGMRVMNISAAAQMGDGIMYVDLYYGNRAARLRRKLKELKSIDLVDIEKQIDQLEEKAKVLSDRYGELIRIGDTEAAIAVNQEYRKTVEEIADLGRKRYDHRDLLRKKSEWKYGDPIQDRPETVHGYKNPADDMFDTMEHEFGHHIHQQLFPEFLYKNADDLATVYQNPLAQAETMESSLKTIYQRINKNRLPSNYSKKNYKEMFAESYELWQSKDPDLRARVPAPINDFCRWLDDLAAGTRTRDEVLRLMKGAADDFVETQFV